MTTRSKGLTLAAVVMMLMMAVPAMAQQQGGGGGNGGGGGGGGGRGGQQWDPAAMKQRMMDRLKQELGTSDEEFTAIEPKLDKVMTAQQNSRAGGMFGGRGGRGGRGGNNNQPQQPTTPVATASQDLQKLLDDKASSETDVKAKLAALRDAKTKAKDELTKAQDDLKSVLTPRQEAVLVQNGMLE